MIRLLLITLSLILRGTPDRQAAHVTCYDWQGRRVELVVLRPPDNYARFCIKRGLLPAASSNLRYIRGKHS